MKTITNEIVKRFEQYLYEEERSDNTIDKYMRDIRFFRECLGGKPVFQVWNIKPITWHLSEFCVNGNSFQAKYEYQQLDFNLKSG